MGIDARIETELGDVLGTLGDPHNRTNWLLRFAILDSTVCLRFIDSYGSTIFNRLQIPVLQTELSALASRITETNLDEGKRVYLELLPKLVVEEARATLDTLSIAELRHHLHDLLRLLSETIARGPHHYIRFVGD